MQSNYKYHLNFKYNTDELDFNPAGYGTKSDMTSVSYKESPEPIVSSDQILDK